MNIVLLFSFPIVVFIFILQVFTVTSADVALVDDNDSKMIPIDSDVSYQNITSIIINIDPYLLCDGAFFYDRIYPNTTFTIFPSNEGNGVTIETSPPNLVTVRTCIASKLSHCPDIYKDDDENNILEFDWNTDVSSTATSGGGVRIGVPPDQLQAVSIYGGHNVQVLDGFTHITGLHVRGDGAILRASMTSLSNSTKELVLRNRAGKMHVETNIPVTDGRFFGGSQSWVETPFFHGFRVAGTLNGKATGYNGSQLNIKGNVSNNEYYFVDDNAQLTVTGTITGTIKMGDNSTVNAPSCDNVALNCNDCTCNAGPQSVDVDVGDVSQNNQILYGMYTCGGSFYASFAQGYSLQFLLLLLLQYY
ncbi:hypothetical protein FRACYDRAFT_270477 [Fragilariopsis cylindrus CCMP1102]|uniref:Auto-transporter adhesin head GIN domain-containing protein n=1 Tax=Fragilariopsis cylindrus CCMP1102 TaxID=635003 RepID=A0A1E7F3Q3_9STRA|nr:hypothetical protein FRACYDRAFT_270477 [Fragilariopsis cylindrus CCMP1102]|eukprot:OEU12777.1 hypothetical protein FRACYDRAFT_270477 [Fragilariopsis cylindrus CCMP1102]